MHLGRLETFRGVQADESNDIGHSNRHDGLYPIGAMRLGRSRRCYHIRVCSQDHIACCMGVMVEVVPIHEIITDLYFVKYYSLND